MKRFNFIIVSCLPCSALILHNFSILYFLQTKKGAFGGYLKQMFWLYILHVLWTSHTHIKPEICLQNAVPSRRSRMLLNIRSECLYSTFQSHVNDKTGFWSSTSVPFLISLSSCNLSTVGCWDCKSISGFSRQLNVILERGVTPTLSYLPAFKSWKEMPTNLGSFMQPSPLIYSSLNHIFEHKKKKKLARVEKQRTEKQWCQCCSERFQSQDITCGLKGKIQRKTTFTSIILNTWTFLLTCGATVIQLYTHENTTSTQHKSKTYEITRLAQHKCPHQPLVWG